MERGLDGQGDHCPGSKDGGFPDMDRGRLALSFSLYDKDEDVIQ